MIFKFQHEGRVYTFDDEVLSIPEMQWVKRETGFKGIELFEEFNRMDVDALLAVFCLALKRGGIVIETLDDAPLDPQNGYVQLIKSAEAGMSASSEPQPEPAPAPVRRVRKKAVAKG